jgi:methionyl-tRNA synthetase
MYTAVLTDAISRWKKMKGMNVKFATGTDEHGMKVIIFGVHTAPGISQLLDNHVMSVKAALRPQHLVLNPHTML